MGNLPPLVCHLSLVINCSDLKDLYIPKGPRPYSSCHAKRQNDVLGGSVGKNYPLVTFSPWQDEYFVLCFVFFLDFQGKM